VATATTSVGGRGKVLVVGVGDDGPGGLTSNVRARVYAAGLLVGGRRHLDLFAEHPGERLVVAGDLAPVLDRIDAESGRRCVVVLASGDPCFYGIGPILAARLGPERVELVPSVSAVALAFARLGLSWHDATVVSAHGRPLDAATRAARSATKLAVLTDDVNTPAVVAQALLAAGAEDAATWVFEHLGGPAERSISGCLSEIAEQRFAELNVLVVPKLRWRARNHLFGRPEGCFAHSRSMITKPEVRAISLSKLGLQAGDVLWDVGAGSGSLAIEAAGLVPGLSVVAVERSAEQIGLLRQNLVALGAGACVHVVHGEAPDALANLPAPNAIFLGGTGGKLDEILARCYDALRPGGRIVANLVTLERVSEVLGWTDARSLQVELVQVSVARGVAIQSLMRLEAQNPVFVVTVTR
jgi:precorrin-6Y C5,15-methyltransferase (decarboxylating)